MRSAVTPVGAVHQVPMGDVDSMTIKSIDASSVYLDSQVAENRRGKIMIPFEDMNLNPQFFISLMDRITL